MKCYRKILRISWTERKTNASVLEQLGVKAPQLLNLIKKQKLSYFGHIKRHNTLEKLFLEGTCEGRRGRGRPRRRWTLANEWDSRLWRLEDKHLRKGSFVRQFGRPRPLRIRHRRRSRVSVPQSGGSFSCISYELEVTRVDRFVRRQNIEATSIKDPP